METTTQRERLELIKKVIREELGNHELDYNDYPSSDYGKDTIQDMADDGWLGTDDDLAITIRIDGEFDYYPDDVDIDKIVKTVFGNLNSPLEGLWVVDKKSYAWFEKAMDEIDSEKETGKVSDAYYEDLEELPYGEED